MFRYKMKFADALQAFVKYTHSDVGQVEFDDPALNQYYADEANGLCTIVLITPESSTAIVTSDSELEIEYADPELEFQRRLQF